MRWLFGLFLGTVLAHGQQTLQFYTTDNGLPDNSILAMLQARDGYLWFTTYRGIVRFDGVNFQIFDSSNTPAIHSTTFAVFALLEDHQGDIWAGAWSGGALRYHDGEFRSYTVRDGLPLNSVLRIDEDDQGSIWFYTSEGLARFRDGKIETVKSIDGQLLQPYLKKPATLVGDSGLFGLWRINRGGRGLERFARGKWADIPLPPGVGDLSKLHLEVTAEDRLGRLWYTIPNRPRETYCVDRGHLTIYSGLPAGSFANFRDGLGRLWITDRKGHTALWEDGGVTPLAGLSTPSPLRVVADAEGSFWVGTLNQGLAHAPVQLVHTIRLPGGPEINRIQPALEDRKGDIWVGSYGLTRLHDGQFESFRLPASIAPWRDDQWVWSLWAEPDGTIYFSTSSGPKVFRSGKAMAPGAPLDQIKVRVNAIIRDRKGDLWLGAGDDIYRNHGAQLTQIKPHGGHPLRGEIRAIAQDQSGAVWVGTDAVLCRYRGELTCFGAEDEFSRWRIRSIVSDAQGVVWATTADRGILRVEGDAFRWIQAKDGLFSNDGSGIFEDGQGYFWIGSRLGIYRVRKEELNLFARGATDHVTSSYFGKNDGLSATDTVGFGQPHGFRAQDGSIWFPTTSGLARLNPAETVVDNSPPHVKIESCRLEQKAVACHPQLSLPPGAGNLEINYTAVDLARSSQIQFRYRLAPLDTNWVNAGTRRTAYYPHLPPGEYRFQVMGASSFGVWTEAARELRVRVLPHYYQTAWFRELAGAAAIGLFLLMWRIRGIQYRKRQAAQRVFAQQIMSSQESERKRIAGELHDSLGQRLTVIRNMAILLARPNGKNREQHIEAIAAETTQAIDEVRQISRNLRPYQLDLLGLTKSIELLVGGVSNAAGIQAETAIDDLAGAFPKELEIHVYRIVQECLNNAVKHANPAKISVRAERGPAGVTLTVSDDGAGFAGSRVNGEAMAHGFGLTGIGERARLLGGTSTFRSTPGQGTTVLIEIPSDPSRAGAPNKGLTHE